MSIEATPPNPPPGLKPKTPTRPPPPPPPTCPPPPAYVPFLFMSIEATPPTPHAMLDELAQLGITVARAITQSIQHAAPEELAANRETASAAFERAARAVRRTILLRQHLETRPNSAA